MSASDEIIWQCINQNFCSYKVKAPTQNFCRNEYNVSGLCNRQSCPLANAQYATVREKDGRLYLYMSTVERSHLPAKRWERIRLSKNYAEALKQIDTRLAYWPKFSTHKCKQRLTKLTQYLIKSRRLALAPSVKLIPIKPKQTKREAAREQKALIAAKLEKTIQKELIERLKSGVYGDQPLNVNEGVWNRYLDAKNGGELVDEAEELEDEEENELEFVEESDLEQEDIESAIEDWWGDAGAGSDVPSESEEDDEDQDSDSDDSDTEAKKKRAGKRKAGQQGKKPAKKPRRVEVEYEYETEPQQQTVLAR